MYSLEFLLEYDQNITLRHYGPKLVASARKDPTIGNIPNDDTIAATTVLNKLESIDNTTSHNYTAWLARHYSSGEMRYEDVSSVVADALVKYEKLKIKRLLNPEDRDIGRFGSFNAFLDSVGKYADPVEKQQEDRGNYEVVYDGPDCRIIWPKNETAAKFWGRGTRWCTAADKNNYFDRYVNSTFYHLGLRILIPKNPDYAGEKYQYYILLENLEYGRRRGRDWKVEALAASDSMPQESHKLFMKILKQYYSAVQQSMESLWPKHGIEVYDTITSNDFIDASCSMELDGDLWDSRDHHESVKLSEDMNSGKWVELDRIRQLSGLFKDVS